MRRSRARTRLILSTTVRPVSGRAVLRRPRGGQRRPRANRSARDWSMPNKMLVDATHPEETRVVVLRGHRVEEFDFESASRKQLRGNIYLAKVTRVEPSLQAAFVDYGGNRHGFLAFSEIHPDYYQIPVADRQALIAEDERAQRAAEAEADRRAGRRQARAERASEQARDEIKSAPIETEGEAMAAASEHMAPLADATEEPSPDAGSPVAIAAEPIALEPAEDAPAAAAESEAPIELAQLETTSASEPVPTSDEPQEAESHATDATETADIAAASQPSDGEAGEAAAAEAGTNITEVNSHGAEGEDEVVESVGGADAMEEVPERMPRVRRQYKIQEVIKRRQVMLVQVVKEERGTKGAALTTYLSLAGRYSVLMPNTARGGGISRKITSADDRRRLKDIAQELEVPEGMGVILRTAGASRTKTEVKRDFEYLLRLWETVRDLTLKSTAATLVYEEGSLVKRSIRDLYNKDIDEIVVAGEDAYKEAKEFMRMLMPSHAKNVKPYREALPIFTRHGIESQLDAMFTPVMQLRSGGYIVLNQAEALVAIDVNSGRATREHHIEDTALKTNLEAAEEIARQLRLRDLAGLIVIDFIDMEENRNQVAVERRLKEALKNDRARIQVGRISPFGLLEMSRQRLRPSLVETSTQPCPHCGGTGSIRSTESTALYVLRSIEEEGMRRRSAEICVYVPTTVALYILNQKRDSLAQLESRYGMRVLVARDDALIPPAFRLERLRAYEPAEAPILAVVPLTQASMLEEEEDEDEVDEAPETSDTEQNGEEERGRSRRRRRRRRRHEEEPVSRPTAPASEVVEEPGEEEGELIVENGRTGDDNGDSDEEGDAERRRRRRGRRGGRRRGRREGDAEPSFEGSRPAADTIEILPTPGVEESVPTLVEARANWPFESGTAAIETASLPALAG